MERTSIFGNRGSLRRNYDTEDYEDLLDDAPPESILPDEPTKTNVFGRGSSLRRIYCGTDFEILFGHTHEERFPENGSQNGKGGE